MSTPATFSNRPVSRRREGRESGIAIMITAFMMAFTIPCVGLAIDASMLYVIRGRLAAACDAAALATARNLNMGLTLSEQTAAAIARGNAFFYANFPNGYLNTSTTTPQIVVAQSNLSTLTVTATANTNAPLYFMRVLGGTSAVAGAVGRASRRDVNLMLVLDRSGSMAGTPCASMINAAKTFTNMFVHGRDMLGMVTFGGAAFLAYPPTTEFKTASNALTSRIDQITCGGWTNSAEAYWDAYQQLLAINEPLALNMIVFFTDGVPTAFTARFPIKTLADSRRGDGVTCATNTTCTLPPSTCTDDNGRSSTHPSWGTFAPKLGVAAGGGLGSTTGATVGLLNPTATSFSTSDPLIPSGQRTNCAFSGNSERFRRDIAFIPATNDAGLATTGYQTVSRFTAAGHPYLNGIRPDSPDNIARVAMNLADNAAMTARNNATLNVVTYTIGLGDVDETLLKRMANDPTANNFDNTRTSGLYVYAPNATDLNGAFARIASEILRLAQ